MPGNKTKDEEHAPPALSDKLVAQLQNAVMAAQRGRMSRGAREARHRIEFLPAKSGVAASSDEEIEVYISSGGRGRAAVARRSDGQYCLYVHWRPAGSWMIDDAEPAELLYPELGLYRSIAEARDQVRLLRGFADAVLRFSRDEPSGQ